MFSCENRNVADWKIKQYFKTETKTKKPEVQSKCEQMLEKVQSLANNSMWFSFFYDAYSFGAKLEHRSNGKIEWFTNTKIIT